MAELREALAAAGRGRGSVAVLVGEAGIGKTRTAAELAAHAAANQVTILKGRCYEGEETPPYGPWRTALKPLPASRLAPEAASLIEAAPGRGGLAQPAAEARIRLYDAVIEVLRAAARQRPLLVFLDNLQWADPGSLKLLEHLSAEIADVALLVLGTYRDTDLDERHPLRSTLPELAKESAFRRIALGGLSSAEVASYLGAAMDAEPSAKFAREAHRRTDGNPLFLLELVRDLAESQSASAGRHRIPPGVREAIGARLDRLPAETVRVLSAAAVIGRIFPLDLLCAVAEDGPADRVITGLEQARRAGFVQEMADEAGQYRFSHALVQEVLYSGVPGPLRARRHARTAAAMEARAGPHARGCAAAIAHHLAEAGDPQSLARLVPVTLEAAESAVADLAPDQAVTLLERALRAKEGAPASADADTAELLYRHACALEDTGRGAAAAQSLSRAFDIYARVGDVDRMVEVALTPVQRATRIGGSVTWSYADTGLADLRERALAVARPGTIQQGRLLAQQSSPADIERALAIARREGDERLEMTALWHLAHAHLCGGEFARARSEEDEARAIAGRLGDRWGARFLLYWRCRSSALVGDLPALQESAREMLADAERAHSRLSIAAAHQACAIVAHMTGDWDSSREHARACLRLQPGRGETHSHEVTLATLALTEYETGNVPEAEKHLRALGSLGGDPRAPFPFYIPKMAWITGDTSRIDAAAEALGGIEPAAAPFDWVRMSRDSALALVAVMRGDLAEATRSRNIFLGRKGLRIPYNASGMPSDGLIALLAETLGRHEEADAAFEDALAFGRRSGSPPEFARTCRDYGEALLRRGAGGPVSRAEAALREGLAVAREFGMRPTTARIEAALEAAGRLEPPVRPGGLSAREIEVLRIVARGLTNAEIGERLFISPNTVARHLQNVLEKTGMANRTEATAFAFRNGLIRD